MSQSRQRKPGSTGEKKEAPTQPLRRSEPAPVRLDNQSAQRHYRVGDSHDAAEQAADRQADGFMAAMAGRMPAARDYQDYFRLDLASVRVHHDSGAHRAADALSAEAFTRDRDIYFAQNRFDPRSTGGQRLLAHELAHVAADRGRSRVIRRQTVPGAGGGGGGLQVEVVSAESLREMGIDPDQIPESRYTPVSTLINSAGMGVLLPPMARMTNLPLNTTGVLWEGAHISDACMIDGRLSNVRGFRAELMRHALATGERQGLGFVQWLSRLAYPPVGANTSLNKGVPGTYAPDWMFPFNPRASMVYRTDGAVDPVAFAEFIEASAPQMQGKQYTFSPPKPGTPAYTAAYGANGTPPKTVNCVNLPMEQHRRALGLGPGEPVPFVPQEGAKGRFLDPVDSFFFGNEPLPPGLGRTRIGPAMLGAGIIKAGGTFLMVYGARQSYHRIVNATPGEEQRMVVSEEAGAWTGGLIGGMLAEALGAAFICTGTGPGAFFCLAGVGLVGGFAGGTVGHGVGHDIGEQINNSIELLRNPAKMIEAAAVWDSVMNGTDSAQQYYETREALGGEPSPWPF